LIEERKKQKENQNCEDEINVKINKLLNKLAYGIKEKMRRTKFNEKT